MECCKKEVCGKNKDEVCDKKNCKKMKKKAMKIICTAVLLMCPEWEDQDREILCRSSLLTLKDHYKETCKSGCCQNACQTGCCQETCKPGCCQEACKCGPSCKEPCAEKECPIECMIKKNLKCWIGMGKPYIKAAIDLTIASYVKAFGDLPPQFGPDHKFLIKNAAKVIREMHKKMMEGECCKGKTECCKTECCGGKCGECKCEGKCQCKEGECKKEAFPIELMMKIADEGWHEAMHNKLKKIKKKAKKIAEDATFFCCDCDCDIGKKVMVKLLTKKIMMKLHCMKICGQEHIKKMCERWGPPKEEAKGAPPQQPMHGPGPMCGPPPFMGMGGKRKHFGRMFKECIKRDIVIFAGKFVRENCEKVKDFLKMIEEVLKESFKDFKCSGECYEKCLVKIARECWCQMCCGECTPEKCKETITKYVKEIGTCCDKACIKRCKKVFKVVMRLNGVKDQEILRMGSKWGASMCCHVNGIKGCPKDEVAQFAAKWVKDFTPIVVEAFNLHEALLKEDKEGCKGTFKKEHFCYKKLLNYLQWNCFNCKFDKEAFKAHYLKCKEHMKAFCEKEGQMSGKCGGPCKGKCEGKCKTEEKKQ